MRRPRGGQGEPIQVILNTLKEERGECSMEYL